MHAKESKQTLRRQIRERLADLPEPQRVAASARARERLSAQAAWNHAQSILFFAPLPEEPDLWPLIWDWLAAGKIAALPGFDLAEKKYVARRIQDLVGDIKSGQFGIREPQDHCALIPLSAPELVLVPGTAFDLHGRRLGRGKGFYDQLLTQVRGRTCGVAFDEQIVPEVPVESHDVRVNYLLTPTRWVEF